MPTYTVKSGDNLVKIARELYGNERMFAEIMRLNKLGSGVIRPGMVLNLPQNKANSEISISGNLLTGLAAENKGVKQPGVVAGTSGTPTPASLGVTSQNVDLARQQRQERNMFLAEVAQQAGPPSGVAPSAPKPTGTPSGWTPEARKAYAERNVPSPTSQQSVYAKMQEPYRYQPPTATAQPFSIFTPGAVSTIPGPGREAKLSPELQYSQQAQAQIPPKPVTPPATMGAYAPVPFATQEERRASTLGLTRSNLTEQQLPNPQNGMPDNQSLAKLGMTPSQIDLYQKAFVSDLTQTEADQYRMVFNIQPGSNWDQLLQGITINPVAPNSNAETMGSIYADLMDLPSYYQMPTPMVTGGGGGGGGGNEGGYRIGGGFTWGGF